MIRAYSEIYLSNNLRNLSALFDMAVYSEDMDVDNFTMLFATSNVARGIEQGSPKYLAGMSPQEMFREITNQNPEEYNPPSDLSDAGWTGYIIAYTQWYCGSSFREIAEGFPSSRMMSLHRTLHNDVMNAVSIVIDTLHPVAILKDLRESRGMSQSDLALISGVPIRSIRAYEQGTVDLCKAQGDTLHSLAKALGCTVDTLIRG